ncbi:immunity 49 family protein [Nocardia asteroides]|uniref:immunity 49 family protein n=1 Tax=Nocardia asteroides TaxID=1824 RepID=UPI0036699D59
MLIERPYIDHAYVHYRIVDIDAQVSAFVQDGAENPRTASILPGLLLNRLLHLLALEEPDWFAAKSAAAAVLDAYEALVDLVDATRREGSSANGSLFTDYNGQRKSERSSYQVSLTPVDFFNAFWIAVILGDARRLDLLAAMPIDAFSSQNVQADRFQYCWIEALQYLQQREERWAQKFGDAIYLSDPARVEVASADSVHYLLYPPIKLFHALMTGTEASFNSELEDALVRHRYYWVHASEHPWTSESWVSLPLTAIACMALSKGYRVESTSAYLPLPLGLRMV